MTTMKNEIAILELELKRERNRIHKKTIAALLGLFLAIGGNLSLLFGYYEELSLIFLCLAVGFVMGVMYD